MAQVNPFAQKSNVDEVSLDDDLPVIIPKKQLLSPLHRAQLKAWVEQSKLDDDQKDVVFSPPEGVHKVQANAGAGKTHTLIARAIYMLATTEAQPSDLVMLTFTNRAAREIKERYKAIIFEVTGQDRLPIPFIGTIHSYAFSLISRHEGYNQTILGESAGRSLLRRLIANDLFPDDKEKREAGQVRRLHELYQQLVANNELHVFMIPLWISGKPEIVTWRDKRYAENPLAYRYLDQTSRSITTTLTVTPEKLISASPTNMDDEMRREIRKHYCDQSGLSENELTTTLKAFMEAKYANRTFEFTDLLYYPLAYLCQHPAQALMLWDRPTFIFQDEAQDQDTFQFALLRFVAGPNPNLLFCADTKQTLYFWRQARPDLTDALDRICSTSFQLTDTDSGLAGPRPVAPHYLRTNYRSRKQLVELANLFATTFTTKAATPSIPFRDPAPGCLGIRFYDTSHQENKAIAREIAVSVRQGKRNYRDYAVLTRTNRSLLDLEASFVAERIPYHLKHDGKATTKQSTFRVMAAYYALALNPRDVPAFCEVLEPIKGLGDKFLLKLQNRLTGLHSADKNLNILNFTINNLPDVNPAQTQYKLMSALLDMIIKPFVGRILSGKFTIPQLNEELRQLYAAHGWFDGQEPIASANKTFDWQFSEGALARVTRTLDQIYTTLEEDQEFTSLGETDKIAAIHAILALGSDDAEPDDDTDASDFVAAGQDKKDRVTLATGHAFKGKQAPVVYVAALQGLAPPKEDPEEEDRCWMYVAVTRAQENLYLSAAHMVPGFDQKLKESRPNRVFNDYLSATQDYKDGKRA